LECFKRRNYSAGLVNRYPLLPGLALSAALAGAAMLLGGSGWLSSHGLSPLTLAMVLGLAVGNSIYPRIATASCDGVRFSKQILLRAGVILYGLRLTLTDIGHVGVVGVLIDALVILSTFSLACLIGTRFFGLDRRTAMLIGAGSAICGAAAVMATEPVVRGRADQVTVAISTVVLFGTVAIFLYPLLYSLNIQWLLLPSGANAFGIYAGSTIHEVAQVVAAGRSVGADTANTAVITKLVRVMMLAPFLIGLSAWLARDEAKFPAESSNECAAAGSIAAAGTARPRLPIPWFAFGFILVVMFNSLSLLPQRLLAVAINVDTLLLAMAMAALGLSTHLSAIRQAGLKPLLLGCILFVWLIIGGGTINRLVENWL
jgi:uncharacterized integral membrane protein (TIGR00698 family)